LIPIGRLQPLPKTRRPLPALSAEADRFRTTLTFRQGFLFSSMPFGSANQEDLVASSIFFEGLFVLILNETLKP